MTEQLTLRELEMIQDTVFQLAGDAPTVRQEDRSLALERKVAQMGRDMRAQACECGHLRGAHRSRTDVSTCVICHCTAFTRA